MDSIAVGKETNLSSRMDLLQLYRSKLETSFPDLDLSDLYFEPRARSKLNLWISHEKYSVVAQAPRLYQVLTMLELELITLLDDAGSLATEDLLLRLKKWIAKQRFVSDNILDTKIVAIESGKEIGVSQPLGFAHIKIELCHEEEDSVD